MAKQTRTNLATRAGTIASEQTTGANTAPKVGGLLNDIVDTFATEFEPTRSYKPGEYIIWNNRNVRCLQATTAGQSPATHPVKWDDKVIDSLEKLGPLGDNFPVLAAALKAYVASAVANGPTSGANLRKATLEELNEKLNDTAYVTPYLVGIVTDALLTLITGGISEKDLLELTQDAGVDTADHPSQLSAVKTGLAIKLSELISLEATQNVVINGSPNNFIWRGPAGTAGGYYAQWSDVFNGTVTKFFSGIAASGLAGTIDGAGGETGFLAGDYLLRGVRKFFAGQVPTLFQDVSLSRLLSLSGSITGLFAPQTDVNTGESKLVLATGEQVFGYILPRLTAHLDMLGLTGGMTGDSRPVLGILCYDAAPPSGDALTYQDIDISPAMIGVMQSHNLQVSGNLIYPVLTDSEYRNAFDYMTIVFTGTTGYTITGASDFTGQLHLQKRNLAN